MEVLTVLYFIVLIGCTLWVLKLNNAYKQRTKIIYAIRFYLQDLIRTGEEIEEEYIEGMYKTVEPFGKTVLRLWDWSDKNIVDRATYELIKGYIER